MVKIIIKVAPPHFTAVIPGRGWEGKDIFTEEAASSAEETVSPAAVKFRPKTFWTLRAINTPKYNQNYTSPDTKEKLNNKENK